MHGLDDGGYLIARDRRMNGRTELASQASLGFGIRTPLQSQRALQGQLQMTWRVVDRSILDLVLVFEDPAQEVAVDVLAEPDFRQHLPQYSQWPTFPQVFIDGELVGGCDIVLDLYQSGELQRLVAQQPA